MEEIILASTSPRRKEIFRQMCLPFRIIDPRCDEERLVRTESYGKESGGLPANRISGHGTEGHMTANRVKKLALMKGKSVFSRVQDESPPWIAGFDTLVELDGIILGKAASEKEAFHMLVSLSGKVHSVFTGIALYGKKNGKWDIRVAKSKVKFAPLTREEINFYLSTGEWQGVAGSYRIQERGSLFVEWIKGSYSNIVGLPISLFYVMLKNNNYSFSLRQDN